MTFFKNVLIIIIIITDKRRLLAGLNNLANYMVKMLHKISWGSG